MSNPAYVLGHAERELERLKAQDRLIPPFTCELFQLAGMAGGMRGWMSAAGRAMSPFSPPRLSVPPAR